MRPNSAQRLVARLLGLERPSPARVAMHVGVSEATLRAFAAGSEDLPVTMQERVAMTALALAPTLGTEARRLQAQLRAARNVRDGTVRGSMTRPMGEWL